MEKEEIILDTIEGMWEWCALEIKYKGKWRHFYEVYKGECFWSFTDDGKMFSEADTWLDSMAEYRYYPKILLLYLEGWRKEGDGPETTPVHEIYRVEFATPTEMILYDQRDVGSCEDEMLRLRLRKI